MRLTRPAALLTILLLLLSFSHPSHAFPAWAGAQTGYSLAFAGAICLGAAVYFFIRERTADRLQLVQEHLQVEEHRRQFEHDRRTEEDGYEMADLGPVPPAYQSDGGAPSYSPRSSAVAGPHNSNHSTVPQEALRDDFGNILGLHTEHQVRADGVTAFAAVFRPEASAHSIG